MSTMLKVGALAGAAVLGAMLATQSPFAGNSYAAQKVVYHFNEDGGPGLKRYKAAVGNIRNHMNAVGDGDIDVTVVMHSDGVMLLRDARGDEALRTALDGLRARGVTFALCDNTLAGRNLDLETDFHDVGVTVVPSGVAELSKLQQMGYTYIKP